MKVALVNCFDTYEDRVDLIRNFFIQKDHEVTVVQSNFRHFRKEIRKESKKDFVFIKTKPYYKNLSGARLNSHYSFAKDAFKKIEEIKPDLLYVLIPPNSLAKLAANYKKKNKQVKLVFDLIDLWPETMPVGKVENIPPFTLWKSLRNSNLQYADEVITECDLYQSVLKNTLNGVSTNTIYLAKEGLEISQEPNLASDQINLCYLGSINNIIDISRIKRIVEETHKIKNTTVHIIGDGEKRVALINEIKSTGAKVEYYGKIYNSEEKQKIFNMCHFGLNIMKESVCVGLTMKSMDYFQAGLPILNTIKSDTYNIVRENHIGFNINDHNIEDVVKHIDEMDMSEFLLMRANTKKVFNGLFSITAFNRSMQDIFG
ncbi:glycosyltransferase [Rossellomorea marisflavi]|uniref:glycosyltransferase n=1 Tax=Rossellomorea marisflavi TaxID=189381 RepID=UPI003FA12585